MKDHIIGKVLVTTVKKEEQVMVKRYLVYQETFEKKMKNKEGK